MKAKERKELAKFILNNVGGNENVVSLIHCVTRLRFTLKDESKANTQALKDKDGVIDVIQKGGMYQVVIGNAVTEVFDEVMAIATFSKSNEDMPVVEEKKKPIDNLISTIAGIFTPILGLMCGCGVVKGLIVFLGALGLLSTTSGTYIIINAIGDSIFYFFPVFIGYTAAEKFGMNKFVGMAIGASLIHPNIIALNSGAVITTLFSGTFMETSVKTTLVGIPVMLMSYSSTVIPAILACFVGSKIEKFFKKIIPDVLKMFLVPAFTLVITVSITLIIVGPVATWLSDLIGVVFLAFHDFCPPLAGALIGGTWQLLVMFGLHQGITPIMFNNLVTNGCESVICCMQAVPFTTCAVVFAVYLKTKNKKLKRTALPAAISSFFGVSEPSIYGVTIPLKIPFIITNLSAAVGGALMGLFGSKMYTMGGMGLFAFPAYISPENGFDMGFYGVLIAVGVSMLLGFVLTLLLWKEKPEQAKAN
ncbi:PTS transporter subunit EIIC [Lachnospira pectinoschiza]|uniref:PTS system beta-glucoside-specific IIA component, Glc family /PTS system beta-glucoside-specific IIB component, Glc family /PTS system beta-glucoside-specific IIC component, Glc family n=1 Tax=Lachnospira pectinoschiza TaxID=28052 RepID=A0A1G9ZJ96_9FIRM|nr:PTS transporter subunit EIIC [Lachnospira pectinoschiza]SDN21101.1 PTS system beta-glucoside-specific IIA component, Glc family /PTS system beta-glucoside-specific IIB component, Glc family /PTS system beta-glucoside-specific IIC component, Glc family [Lachnospira pectinoschiza]